MVIRRDDTDAGQSEDAARVRAAKNTIHSESQCHGNDDRERGSEAAVTMAPLLACKQCFTLDARLESSSVPGAATVVATAADAVSLVCTSVPFPRPMNSRRDRHGDTIVPWLDGMDGTDES